MANKGQLFIISAPSGSGKTTLEKMLLDSDLKLERSISATTRPPRKGETESKDYYFISKVDFLKKRQNDEFLDWAQVLNNYYGTPKAKVEEALKENKNVLLSIDVQGAEKVKNIYPDAVSIFIKPPNIKELEKRLKQRKTDKEEDIEKRLRLAKQEMSKEDRYDYIVVNEDINKAFNKIKRIIKKHLKE
jgi:guanylate kinase